MISSKSYESCTDTRIYQIHKNIQIIILLENEAPCIKKLFHFFLFFFLYLYHEQRCQNMVLYTNNHDPN